MAVQYVWLTACLQQKLQGSLQQPIEFQSRDKGARWRGGGVSHAVGLSIQDSWKVGSPQLVAVHFRLVMAMQGVWLTACLQRQSQSSLPQPITFCFH